MENIEPTKVTEENGEQKSENTENGEAPTGDENGNVTQENQENGEQTNGEALKGKTVEGILAKIKNNTEMKDGDKVDTLCLLLKKIIAENHYLKSEMSLMGEQMDKSNKAKEAVKQLNSAYKKQIELVKEETTLRVQEEGLKRQECVDNYTVTMGEITTLLETHTDHNTRLRDENSGMATSMMTLVQEGEKREKVIEGRLQEYRLQIQLLEHQVTKAQLEKAEVKADMTKDRLEIAQELNLERERTSNLEETVRLLKEQAAIYQDQLTDLASGAGNNSKSFQHFKNQIDKLTKNMQELDKDTHTWRERYESSSLQVKKMNTQSLEREKEVGQLKKKLDSMIKLNKTLSDERASLNSKLKLAEKSE